MKTEQSRIRDYDLLDDVSELFSRSRQSHKSKRSTSIERSNLMKKKVSSPKLEEKPNPENKKTVELVHTPKFNEDYYLLKQAKSQSKRYLHA